MPTVNIRNSQITPKYLLPENENRLCEGGQRLKLSAQQFDRSVPVISVVTVVLNCEDYIEKTIRSITDQLDERIEYIIIDGGSTDSTVKNIQKYEESLEYWVSEPDSGISDAFNKGIALCRGEIVGLLNAGDWFEKGVFDSVERLFREKNDIGVVCGALQYWQRNEKAYIAESRPELLRSEMSVTHPTCFVQREVYLRYGGFDAAYKYAMDYELMLRYHSHGVIFQGTQQILANMLHEGISEQKWREALIETWKARRQYMPDSFYAGRFYLGYLIVRKYIRFILQALGLHGAVRFYREKIAPVKKRLPE